jgi:UDP-N-acetylglucosamine 1-carboxyvinyltransferase
MNKFVVNGGKKLEGSTQVSGAKNVALKALVAASLTSEEVTIDNIPLIEDLFVMADIIEDLGGKIEINDHSARIQMGEFKKTQVSLERAAEIRTSAMFMAPLLARTGKAVIPNPGGCRIGARPIDRTIDGLTKMGVIAQYKSEDGYFHMEAPQGLSSVEYEFKKSTHTGTETLILAAVLAKGKTTLKNTAQEPEVDELIDMLTSMGAKIKKNNSREIEIEGVESLHGTKLRVGPDRNEIVTLAIAALITKGDIFIEDAQSVDLSDFLNKLEEVGAGVEKREKGIRFYYKGELRSADVETSIYPGFMTDWQGPWAVLMTQAKGESTVHERVYENRFGYANELIKMGAKIKLYNPEIKNPQEYYEFNIEDDQEDNMHAAKIVGPSALHNAIVAVTDLRAGATLVLGALAAKGESVILEIQHLDRGYEKLDERLNALGADVKRVEDD